MQEDSCMIEALFPSDLIVEHIQLEYDFENGINHLAFSNVGPYFIFVTCR